MGVYHVRMFVQNISPYTIVVVHCTDVRPEHIPIYNVMYIVRMFLWNISSYTMMVYLVLLFVRNISPYTIRCNLMFFFSCSTEHWSSTKFSSPLVRVWNFNLPPPWLEGRNPDMFLNPCVSI